MRTPEDNGEVAILWRLGRVALVMGCVVAVLVIVVSTGVIRLPDERDNGTTTPASDRSTLAAQQAAANRRWASSACTTVLDWKNELHRDETSTNLGFGPVARIRDAVAATKNVVGQLDKLGLPPGAPSARAQADLSRLRSELESGKLPGPEIAGELGNVVSVDLGLSLVETRACRELVGSPI
jgi:hypothetical protein